jgi:hypothetical protein
MNNWTKGRAAWFVACASLLQVACFSWHEVPASELPKLSREQPRTLQRPCSAPLEVTGSPDVAVTIHSGQVVKFESPVQVLQGEGAIGIAGANRELTRVPLADVRKAEVSQFSGLKTAVWIGLGVASVLAVGALVAVGYDGLSSW